LPTSIILDGKKNGSQVKSFNEKENEVHISCVGKKLKINKTTRGQHVLVFNQGLLPSYFQGQLL